MEPVGEQRVERTLLRMEGPDDSGRTVTVLLVVRGADDDLFLSKIADSAQDALKGDLVIGAKLTNACRLLPDHTTCSLDEMRQVGDLEAEVDQAFGEGASLYGRNVALYAIRDLKGIK